nr:ras responsive element binding protein 1 [Hymenolepis microstoma]
MNQQTVSFFKEEGHQNSDDESDAWDLKKKGREDIKLQPYACKNGVEFFNCPLCSTVDIATRAELTTHLQQHQNNQRREDGKHVCCFCASELSSNSSLERHLLTHTNHRPFACSLCDKAFTTNGNLSRHRRTSHQLQASSSSNEAISINSEIGRRIQGTSVIDHPHAIKNILKKNRKTIPTFRIMLHAIKRRHMALREMGNRVWRPTPRIRTLLLKQRRRIRRYARQLESKRVARSPEVVINSEEPVEALDLSLKHQASPPPLQISSQQTPQSITTQFSDFSSIFNLMMRPVFPAFPKVPLTSSPTLPPTSLTHVTTLSTLPPLPEITPVIPPPPPPPPPPNPEPSIASTYRKKNSYKDAPKLITCPVEGCNQKFPWNSSLKRHILTHTPHKPFACTRCTKSFSTKSNRERHMERVHHVSLKRCHKRLSPVEICSATDNMESEMGETEYLREEEIASMRGNDRAAEDISNRLLKSAGSPLVEPNPQRLANQHRVDSGSISPQQKSFDGEPTAIMCPVCGRGFGFAQSFRRHLKSHWMA